MANWRRASPHPRYLTQFYLMVSLGGALGGVFVAIVAPHLFHSYLEMPIAVAGCAVLAAIALWEDESGVGIAVCALAPAVALWNIDLPIRVIQSNAGFTGWSVWLWRA